MVLVVPLVETRISCDKQRDALPDYEGSWKDLHRPTIRGRILCLILEGRYTPITLLPAGDGLW